jgi:hypothetical protein
MVRILLLVGLVMSVMVMGGKHVFDYDIGNGDYIYSKFGTFNKTEMFKNLTDPYVSLNISYVDTVSGTFHMVVFHHDYYEKVGIAYKGDFYLCCNAMLKEKGICKEINSILINDTSFIQNANIYLSETNFVSQNKELHYWGRKTAFFNPLTLTSDITLQRKGMWYFYSTYCTENENTLNVKGTLEWRNSLGYLSGQIFPFIFIFPFVTATYFILLIWYLIMIIRHHVNIMGIQIFLQIVILLGLLEGIWWSMVYTQYNNKGSINWLHAVIGSMLTSAKITSFRITFLLIGLGYTITKPKLTLREKIGSVIITISFFVTESFNEYFQYANGYEVDVNFIFQSISVFFISAVDTVFTLWIGYEFYQRVINSEGFAKKKMYRRIFSIFLLIVIISVIIFIFEFFVAISGLENDIWQWSWVWEAYWQLVYVISTVIITIIWRPNAQNIQYSFVPTTNQSSSDDLPMDTSTSNDENMSERQVV